MHAWSRKAVAAVAAAAACGVAAQGALAAFTSSADGGSLTVQTATLDAPLGLTATADCKPNKRDRVLLSWDASSSPAVAGYEIDISSDGGTTYAKLKRIGDPTTTSANDGAETGPATYDYEIWAYSHKWTSTPVGSVSVYLPSPTTCT